MMFYLTGASSSSTKTNEIPQIDVNKSLGGYISTSIVPNGNVNALFDMISLTTLKNKPKEIIAIGLVNKFDYIARNVYVRLVTRPDYIGKFKLAAVSVGDDLMMEHIPNRYSEPMQAEFHDVDFCRASVIGKIVNVASVGEIISFQPFDVEVEIKNSGIDGMMEDIINAFSLSSDYLVKRLSEKEFEVISKDDIAIDEPIECYAIGSESAEIEFQGKFQNAKNNTSLVAETLAPGQAIGFWLQREIVPVKISNEKLLENYKNGVVQEKVEEVELVIDYEIGDNPQQMTAYYGKGDDLPIELGSNSFALSHGTNDIKVEGYGKVLWVAIPNSINAVVTGTDSDNDPITINTNTTQISGYNLYYRQTFVAANEANFKIII